MNDNHLRQELGVAHETIRSLQEELAETNRGLVVLTIELEDRVDQRTVELRTAQEELQRTNSDLMQLTLELEDRVAERTEALQSSEARYRLLFESSPLPMWVCDIETLEFLAVNEAAIHHYGYSRSEFLGMTIKDIHPKEDILALIDSVATANEGFAHAGIWRQRKKDGTIIDVEITSHLIEFSGRRAEIVLPNNITERKQVEEKLRRSQEQLAGVIGSAMDAIITIDEEQRIVLFNAAAERMFLYPAEDAIGKPLDQFIPERFRAGHKGHIQNFGKTHVTRRGMGALGALFGLCADGEEFPIEASISQIDSDGRKVFTVILRDITERKRSEEALKEQAKILDLAPVLIRDLIGRILFWNAGSEQMYGWKTEETLDKVVHNLLQTEFPRPIEEIKARLLAHGHWEGELVQSRKNGARLVIASHWVLHSDEQGKPKAILEVNNDITERKQAEGEIRKLNEELEQRVADRTAQLKAANKELEAFSYSVSHDLRAPLRHINGFSQALLEDYSDKLDEGGKNYLQEVRNASQEMAQLIDDVLQLARVTRSEMRSEEIDLSELAAGVVAEIRKREGRRRITVNVEEGLSTRGDRRLLRIALSNLLENAWKFTSRQKSAEIAFGEAKENGESFYFVRDNGAGFDMAFAGKLFGAFQRLHTTGEFEGTGIGLATVQRIINRHGGRVWAEGKVNQGATFFFTLPNTRKQGDGQQSDLTG